MTSSFISLDPSVLLPHVGLCSLLSLFMWAQIWSLIIKVMNTPQVNQRNVKQKYKKYIYYNNFLLHENPMNLLSPYSSRVLGKYSIQLFRSLNLTLILQYCALSNFFSDISVTFSLIVFLRDFSLALQTHSCRFFLFIQKEN